MQKYLVLYVFTLSLMLFVVMENNTIERECFFFDSIRACVIQVHLNRKHDMHNYLLYIGL